MAKMRSFFAKIGGVLAFLGGGLAACEDHGSYGALHDAGAEMDARSPSRMDDSAAPVDGSVFDAALADAQPGHDADARAPLDAAAMQDAQVLDAQGDADAAEAPMGALDASDDASAQDGAAHDAGTPDGTVHDASVQDAASERPDAAPEPANSCTQQSDCANLHCVCANDHCTAGVCAPQDCLPCQYASGDGQRCDGNLVVNLQALHCDTIYACDGRGGCRLAAGQRCVTGDQCSSGLCECADGSCATRKCSVVPCNPCTYTETGFGCPGAVVGPACQG